jgi:prolipoprotein diacylglyceryl transferase
MHAYLPSPSSGVVHLGPLPLRAYAGCILLGAVVAVLLGDRRWVARGGKKGLVADVAATAVPAGLVGARLYHVLTSDQDRYFHHPIEALKIWEGGLGIWGGIAGGALGAWWVLRKHGVPFLPFADALAPCLPIAQAIGRFGNYFNQELYGKRTTLPWGLKIDNGTDKGVFHPTFAYEALWDLGVAGLVLWADRRWQLGRGRAFALYVAAYCVGRAWIEALRIDDAHKILGIRLNDFTSAILFVAAVTYLWVRRGSGREQLEQQDSDVPLTT